MDYKILKKELVYKGFNKLTKFEFEIDSFDGSRLKKETEVLERGDSYSIVIYEKDTDTLLFTEQFRMPVAQNMNGWMLEMVAGRVEGSDNPEDTIKREALEEIGYLIDKIELIAKFYVSPGVSNERIFLYYSEVNTTDMKEKGGGLKEENEDIKLIKCPVKDIKKMLAGNNIWDAKSIVGMQWFIMNKLS
ncbi:MAG TPA: NUDIX hydrolase [Saprospiraceae bacterium]|nr:NUDIX hydrolase [Saprospiraceae bacterium]